MTDGPLKGPAPTEPKARAAFLAELRRRWLDGTLELEWDGELPDALLRDLAEEPLASADAPERTKA